MNAFESKKVGLALGGGVVRGMAHIGVLSVLEKAGIPIDMVAGTSAGSIIGAVYCAGVKPDRIYETAKNLQWWQLARLVFPRRAWVSFDPLEKWLVNELGDLQFSDLKIPLTVVATDLDNGKPVEISQGRLAPAVKASCAVPGFVEPVELGGCLLGDGSLADTVPVSALRKMGADFVIGVDIFTSSIRPRWGPLGMAFSAIEILVQRAGGGIDSADCLIAPQLGGYTYTRLSRREELFQLGVDAAVAKLSAIQEALNPTV